MSRFSFSGLRFRLQLLVLLAVLPALALSIYSGLQQRRHALQGARDQALTLARHASNQQDNLIEEVRSLLITLAQIPQVQQGDPAACNTIFANLLQVTRKYTALVAYQPDGKAFASAPPLTENINVSDRSWYRRLLETRGFVVSEYLIGRRTGKAVIVFSHPVFDYEQRLQAILMAGLDLEWLAKFIARSNMPEGATLTVVDSQGTILARHPGLSDWVGRLMPEAPIIQAMLGQDQGVLTAPGLDGVNRAYGFTSMGPKSGGVHIAVGIPEEEAFAEVRRNFLIHLGALGLVAVLALAAAWFGGDVFIRRQVNDLLGVTQRLGEGDLAVRTGPPYRQGEMGQLAQAFDDMAGSLEQREAARRQAVEELRQVLLGLETKVEERTAELKQVNTYLIREMAERQKAEEQRASHARELDRSNTELEQFAYVASHDLQEPLRIITSYVQLLERRYQGKLDAEADKFIERAVAGAARMNRLINDLLLYSRLGTRGKPFEPTDCEAACRQALDNLKAAVAETGAVVTYNHLPTVMADGGQLTQLFQNLIGNAVKFHREEAPGVHIAADQQGNGWVFTVRDNGIGIEAAYLDRIFGVFQRLHTRTEYPGTGIGLAICKKIVERHGGRIWVESIPGEGSTFYFTIPDPGGIQA
jgi:signal transduction histidine kinase